MFFFCKPYRYNRAKKVLIKIQIKKNLDVELVEYFNGKYAFTIMIPFSNKYL